jgi:MFS family permease
LTTVWGYGELEAGLALTPAPVLAAIAASVAGRRADRRGARELLLAGTVVFAAGEGLLALTLGSEPAYLTEVLPGTALVGIGTGLSVPLLTTIAAESLPAARYAEGSAVNSATRQIGAALGIAAIVAVVGTPSPVDAVDAFAGGWLFGAAAAIAAFAVSLGLASGPPVGSDVGEVALEVGLGNTERQ